MQFYWPYIECFDCITVHLEHENYKANEMQLNNDYELNKLCPLGRINFYFEINGEKILSNIYSVDYELMMNYLVVTAEKPLLDEDFDALVEIEPRMDDEEKESTEEEQDNQKWSYNNSIFKDFIRDNDDLINQ